MSFFTGTALECKEIARVSGCNRGIIRWSCPIYVIAWFDETIMKKFGCKVHFFWKMFPLSVVILCILYVDMFWATMYLM